MNNFGAMDQTYEFWNLDSPKLPSPHKVPQEGQLHPSWLGYVPCGIVEPTKSCRTQPIATPDNQELYQPIAARTNQAERILANIKRNFPPLQPVAPLPEHRNDYQMWNTEAQFQEVPSQSQASALTWGSIPSIFLADESVWLPQTIDPRELCVAQNHPRKSAVKTQAPRDARPKPKKSTIKSLGRHTPYEQSIPSRQKPRPQPLTLTSVLKPTKIGRPQKIPEAFPEEWCGGPLDC